MPMEPCENVTILNFSKCRCDILLAPIKVDSLYEQAFFPWGEETDSEYARNTTSWD